MDLDRHAGPTIDRFAVTRDAAKDIEALGEALAGTIVNADRYVRSPVNAARSDAAEMGRLVRQGPAVGGIEAVGEALASAAIDADRHTGPARDVVGDAADGVLRAQDSVRDAADAAVDGLAEVGEAGWRGVRDTANDVARDAANGAERLGDAVRDAVNDAVRDAVSGVSSGAEMLRDAAGAHVRMYRDPSRERSEEAEDEEDER